MPTILRVLIFLLAATLGVASAQAADPGRILFFGDSLTAGYGLDDPTTQAFPALLQQNIDAAGLPFRVINAGLSGETSAGGLRRIDWVLRQPVDVFVLELGANDGLRGLPLDTVQANLAGILGRVQANNPDVTLVVAGMRMPTSMGDYAAAFDAIFAPLAAAHDATLIPFLLEGVGGDPKLNLPDGIHPTAEGHALIAKTVWRVLEPVLQAAAKPAS